MRTVRTCFLSLSVAVAMASVFTAIEKSALGTPLITFTGGTSTTSFSNRTFGYEFSTNDDPLEVFSLGFWDASGGGLNEAHEVGIWTEDGSTLLVSGTVPSGTQAPLDSGFRFVAVTPVVLAPNTSYLAGAFLGTEPVIRYTSATTDPAITLGSTRFAPTPAGDGLFTAPTESQGTTFDDGYFGPNMNGVPEPSTLTLAGLGLLIIGFIRRKRM